MNFIDHNPHIYILCGKSRAGKDTTARIIKQIYEERKKTTFNLQYSHYIKEYARRLTDWDGSEEGKPRDFLVELGRNLICQKINPTFLIQRMLEDIKVYSYFFDILTISDTRLQLEIEIPRKQLSKVTIIHIVRPNFDNCLTEEQKRHPVENDLENYQNYDYELENDGTIESLYQKVKAIVEEVEKCRN